MKQLLIIALAASSFLFAACQLETTTPDPEPSTTWYVDADGDGYGDENDAGTASTNQPTGYVDNNTDCNDDVATGGSINPAASEDNTDPADLNCNGEVGEAPFIVGDYGPAGGIVFYTENAGINGLEVAPVDQDGGAGAEWGCYGTDIIGAAGTAIGDGVQNSADLTAALCNSHYAGPIAINLVNSYILNGFDDWFLPSRFELYELYLQKSFVSGFSNIYYWSSSEYGGAYTVYAQNFHDGTNNQVFSKANTFGVRAVRYF